MAKLEDLNTQLQDQILTGKKLNQRVENESSKATEKVLKTLKKRLNAKLTDDKVNVFLISIAFERQNLSFFFRRNFLFSFLLYIL